MSKYWSDKAWDDYLYWQTQDKKTLLKINKLVKDIERNYLKESVNPSHLGIEKDGADELMKKIVWFTILMKMEIF